MKKKLFTFTTLIIFAGLIMFFAASIYITHSADLSSAKDAVMETARVFAGLYGDGVDIAPYAGPGGDTRITVISPDGTVLYDSRPIDIGLTENHLDRPEIQAALDGSPEAYVRYSETLGADLIYYALKVNMGGGYVFVRAAIPVAKIDAYLSRSFPPLIIILCAVALLCFVLSREIIGRIIKPLGLVEQRLRLLSSGGYSQDPAAAGYEEKDAMLRGVSEIAQVLQNSLTSLQDEKNKAEYILNNIGDGIITVDEHKKIAFINNAALGFFNAAAEMAGKDLNYLCYDKALAAAVNDCICHEKNTLFELPQSGRIYFVTVKRLPKTMLTMVLLSDVTDSRENEKQREEFFANASHELKTPLTAIKGFNELTVLHNKDENIGKFIDGITRETDRMLSLIGDMLKLSELENTRNTNAASVSLGKVAGEVREALMTVINEKSIAFEIIGDGMVEAEAGHVYELVKNLAENAVRYNNRGGNVSITIERGTKSVRMLVCDDGIGISPKEQTRIFERFYRVEKSRSIRNGGTGLGLSIVKHVCALYGWDLSLKSKPGAGTEVTVTFAAK